MPLAFSPRAIEDIQAIGDYIRNDNSAAATHFVSELTDRCQRLLDAPQGGMPRPELGTSTRSVPFRRYIIFYDVEGDTVTIQRVLHSARDILQVFNDN